MNISTRQIPGRDEAEKVKRCLALFQPNNGVKYAMLVGDEDRFPVRYTKWTWPPKSGETDFHTLFVPVDLYYAALFKEDHSFDDWDGNKDGYFGEVPIDTGGPLNPDDVHVVPNIAVGRVLASKKEEVDAYVSNVMYYESYAFGSTWIKSVLLIATSNWHSDICAKQEYISANYLHGFTVHKLYQDGNSCQNTENPSPDRINSYMDQGVGFVSYMGHGGSNGWGIPNGGYLVDHVKKLNNSKMLPVVVAAACDTGRFAPVPPQNAYQDTKGNNHPGTENGEVFHSMPPQPACLQAKDYESMAEGMTMVKDKGAIAYMGSTITGNDPAPDLLILFFEAFHKGNKKLGDMWRYMVQENYKKWAPPKPGETTVKNIYYYLEPWRIPLFGDPSLRVGGIPH